jgi:uncharacterized protein (TIGR00725 family)
VVLDTRLRIAVLGSASEPEDSAAGLHATRIGQVIASQGAVLLTGGCPGLPHAAVQGAKQVGGLTLAVSPAMNRHDHARAYSYPSDSDVMIFTGMGTKGRNVILVRTGDACVFVGGGMGTLNEFTVAFDDLGPDCAIGVLSGSGGFSDDLPRLAARVHRALPPRLVVESNPDTLMEKVFRHIRDSRLYTS